MKKLIFALLMFTLPILMISCGEKDEIVIAEKSKPVYSQDPAVFGKWLASNKQIKLYFDKDTMSYEVLAYDNVTFLRHKECDNWSYSNGKLRFYNKEGIETNIFTMSFSDISMTLGSPLILFRMK